MDRINAILKEDCNNMGEIELNGKELWLCWQYLSMVEAKDGLARRNWYRAWQQLKLDTVDKYITASEDGQTVKLDNKFLDTPSTTFSVDTSTCNLLLGAIEKAAPTTNLNMIVPLELKLEAARGE